MKTPLLAGIEEGRGGQKAEVLHGDASSGELSCEGPQGNGAGAKGTEGAEWEVCDCCRRFRRHVYRKGWSCGTEETGDVEHLHLRTCRARRLGQAWRGVGFRSREARTPDTNS